MGGKDNLLYYRAIKIKQNNNDQKQTKQNGADDHTAQQSSVKITYSTIF